jgi:alanine racemase
MGYADGIFRRSSQEGLFFTVNGKPAPLIGRVCMDQTVLDVTDIEGVELGTPVTIFGTGALLSVNEAGDILGTINCEMFTNVSRRVPRVYIENGEISEVVDYLI